MKLCQLISSTMVLAAAGCGAVLHAEPPRKPRLRPAVATERRASLAPLDERERALQMLNRFTFGARPGDVEHVLALGREKWLEQQLAPASVPDRALEGRLAPLTTMGIPAEQALLLYPDRGTIDQVATGKRPYPADALLASVYEVQVKKLLGERQDKAHARPARSDAEIAAEKKQDEARASRVAGELFTLPKNERMARLNALPPEDRSAFAAYVAGSQRDTLVNDFTPRERAAVQAMKGIGNQYPLYDELSQAHLLRTILSERQLQEVMTDFWFNHFSVYFSKDSDQWYTTSYERDTIRPRALGKFRDLLIATAESPAMMVYLDNWLSVGPDSPANGVNAKDSKALTGNNKPNKPGNKGLNENYGRELMELHTVGVGGGYSQADVTALAVILTGWGVDRPGQGGPFHYDPRRHEPGVKQWFGYSIDDAGNVLSSPKEAAALPPLPPAANDSPEGMRQGIRALTILAAAPQTAHFLSYKLAQRFVADDPPPTLVDRLAKTYIASDGDIRVMLRALTSSPEFNSRRYFRNKVKTPQEFIASAFRATATDPTNPGALVGLLRQFGEAPYLSLAPTGYPMTADHWMNTGALVARLNFTDQLTHSRFPNQKFDSSRVLAFGLMSRVTRGEPPVMPVPAAYDRDSAIPGPDAALRVLESTLIGGEITPKTDQYIHAQLLQQPPANPAATLDLLTALLLGSPEFQQR